MAEHDAPKAGFEAKMKALRAALANSGDPSSRMLAELAPMVEAYQDWCNGIPDGTRISDVVDAQTDFLVNLIGFTVCFHALNARVPAERVAAEVARRVDRNVREYVRQLSAGGLDSHITGKDGRAFDFRDLMQGDRS